MYTLVRGDCLVEMGRIPDNSVDLILTDPPYGVTKQGWDVKLDSDAMWREIKRIRKERTPTLLFAQTPYDKELGASNIREMKYEWIWEKTNAVGFLNAKKAPMRAHENILVFYKKSPVYNPQKTTGHKKANRTRRASKEEGVYGVMGGSVYDGGTERYPRSVVRISKDAEKYHPTQKPVPLLEMLIATYTNKGGLVLDFTMGSGSTGVAALNLGRRFYGVEGDWEHFCTARERLKEAAGIR